jgi:hypothetical protein
MENIHENQVGEVLSYQYEPEVGEKQAIFKFWDRYKYRTSIYMRLGPLVCGLLIIIYLMDFFYFQRCIECRPCR